MDHLVLVEKVYGSTQLTFFVLSILVILVILAMVPVYLKKNPDPHPFVH